MAYPTKPKERYSEAVDEWKMCISQIDKYDGYLVKLREYGFTLITGLTTAAGFLGTKNESATIQVGTVLVTGFLLWILWRVDQYYQDFFFGAIVRGEVLERKCKRGLINRMSRYASKNNRRRSSKLVIIYLAFLGALLAIGFIFLWNATDRAPEDDAAGDAIGQSAGFYIKPVQSGRDASEATIMNDHISSFLTSPLFWLLIGGFGLVAAHISYTYVMIDKKRSDKYDKVYNRLDEYDKRKANEKSVREPLVERERNTRSNIKRIENAIRRTRIDLEEAGTLRSATLEDEVVAKRKKLISDEEELENEKAYLEDQIAKDQAMEERDLEDLEQDIKGLISSDK